jgi:hypothetical protein
MDYHVKRETCPNCDSDKHRNYVAFAPDKPLTIYVECANCQYLVARYIIQHYVDPNAPFEAFLHQARDLAGDSGRKMMTEIKSFKENMAREFEEIRRAWREHPERRKIYEVLQQDEWGYDDYWGV